MGCRNWRCAYSGGFASTRIAVARIALPLGSDVSFVHGSRVKPVTIWVFPRIVAVWKGPHCAGADCHCHSGSRLAEGTLPKR